MKILLTGASSFVTKSLIDYLSKEKIDIIAVSRSKKLKKKKIKFYKCDLSKESLKKNIWKNVESVIHLANASQNSNLDPIKNLNILKNVLKEMPKTIKNFVYISSQMIYGNPNKIKIKENQKIDPFYSNYSLGKFLCEKYLIQNENIIKKNLFILRISGFIDSKRSLIFKIKNRMKKGKNIVLYNQGKTYRDYLFLQDLCIVIKKILSKNLNLTKKTYIFNLSSIQGYKLISIARNIKKKLNSKSKIILSKKKEIRSNFSFDINLIKKKINFRPKNLNDF